MRAIPVFRAALRAVPVVVLVALATPAAVTAGGETATPTDDEVWITIGEDAFATATDVFRAGPGLAALPRAGQVGDVVLTRIPRSGLEALSARIHEVHRRCGGFVKHESLAEAIDALERLRNPRRTTGVLPFDIDRADVVNPLMAEVEPSQILATITTLSTQFPNRYHQHASTIQSHLWIRDLWASYAANRPDVTVELFSHGGITPQPSVILTIPGFLKPDEVVVLGAHQDSTLNGGSCFNVPTCIAPGADDDASGIATISEAVRVALEAGLQPQRTVKFMAYAAEEVGLDGSDHIAATYLANGTNVVAVLQQDMTGYDLESTIDITLISDSNYTDPQLNAFVGELIDTYLPEFTRTTSNCGYGCSDHASWQVRGFPAAFAFEAPFNLHSPFIHSGGDTVASFGSSAAHAAKFAKIAVAFLVETALDAPLFSDGFESSDTTEWSSTVP